MLLVEDLRRAARAASSTSAAANDSGRRSVGLAGHARVAVAEELDPVDAEDLRRRFGFGDAPVGELSPGSSAVGRYSPSSPRVATTSTTRGLAAALRHRAAGRDRFVVGVGVKGHERRRCTARVCQRREAQVPGRPRVASLGLSQPDTSVGLREPGGIGCERRMLAVLTALVLVAAACGNSKSEDKTANTTASGSTQTTGSAADLKKNVPNSSPGVTDKEINVDGVASKTNPLDGKYAEFADGMQAYFNMVNAEGGHLRAQARHRQAARRRMGCRTGSRCRGDRRRQRVRGASWRRCCSPGRRPAPGSRQSRPSAGTSTPSGAPNSSSATVGDSATSRAAPARSAVPGGRSWQERRSACSPTTSPQSADCAKGIQASFEKYPTAKVEFDDDSLAFGVSRPEPQVAQMKDKGVDWSRPAWTATRPSCWRRR